MGMSVHQVAQPIFDDLGAKGILHRLEDYTHRYPVCWRCREELVFRLVDEWFISMGDVIATPYHQMTEAEKATRLRYQIMDSVRETRWIPDFGFEREMDWLRNMHDWMISKKRYWGLALPIWECADCGWFDVIGSKEELKAKAVAGWEEFDGHTPHRPYIDSVRTRCEKCGAEARRIPDVGNPWLDAGIVAFSTMGYRTAPAFWREWFPADLISESFPGQFRNWFYSMLAMSTIMERRAPFRTVQTYATLLGDDGQEMHKSLGQRNRLQRRGRRDGRGRHSLDVLHSQARAEPSLRLRAGRRGPAPVPAPALECVLLLRNLCEPGRLDAWDPVFPDRYAVSSSGPLDSGAPEPGSGACHGMPRGV